MASYGNAPENIARHDEASEKDLRWSFLLMSLSFAVTHGVCTTPLIVASTELGEDAAYIGNGILYLSAIVSALFVATPVAGELGLKRALVIGGTLFCVYIGGFGIAVASGAGWLQWIAWVVASISGGLAGGIIWVGQGGYFAETGTKLAMITGQTPETEKASLAADFSFWYLIWEVLAKVCFSWLQWLSMSPAAVSFIYFALGVAAVIALSSVQDLKSSSPPMSTGARVMGVVSLWPDPLIWLLSPVNLTFGFCAAFMNGFVNGVYLQAELGSTVVGAIGAITPLIAAIGAKLFGYMAIKTGKGPVITVGALCFLCIPIFLLFFGCCTGWGAWMILLYVFQGLGRAVYESTNRAAFADFYPEDSQNAFANCALQANTAFALSFFLQTSLDKVSLATIVMILAGVTPMCFAASHVLSAGRTKSDQSMLLPPPAKV